MKTRYLVLVFLLFLLTACVDQEKEDKEMEERLAAVESVDSTVEEINAKIQQDIDELDEALKDLDSL